MKFIHLADLHFGKSLHGLSLLEEDQRHWAEQFKALVREEKPQAIVIAGDVYDRGNPNGPVVRALDDLLTGLFEENPGLQILMAAGNHDSGERLSFASRLLQRQGLHIAGVSERGISHVQLEDEQGPVTFWLMPYVFPAVINQLLGTDCRDYDSAVREYLAAQEIDFSVRNVIVAHQTVTAGDKEAERGGSESMVAGVGGIDYTAFDGFDYVALGHIHRAYAVGRPEVRYAGSPMCYHFDEVKQPAKGPVIVELGAKGEPAEIRTCVLEPLHRLVNLEGTLTQLLENQEKAPLRDCYVRAILTDEMRQANEMERLREAFEPYGCRVLNLAHKEIAAFGSGEAERHQVEQRTVTQLFEDFIEDRTGSLQSSTEAALLDFVAQLCEQPGRSLEPKEEDIDRIIAFAKTQEGEK